MASHTYLDTYVERIRAVSEADVQRVAAKYLIEDARTVGWYDPISSTGTPNAAGGGGSSGGSGPGASGGSGGAGQPSKFVEHYRAPESEETAQAAATAPPKASDARRFALANGLTLIVRRNAANPTIALQGLVKAGGIFDPPGKCGLGTFTATMLDRGTKRRSALEIATAIEDAGAQLHFDGGTETVSISANMLSADLATMLDVLADALYLFSELLGP